MEIVGKITGVREEGGKKTGINIFLGRFNILFCIMNSEIHGGSHLHLDGISALWFASATDNFLVGIV